MNQQYFKKKVERETERETEKETARVSNLFGAAMCHSLVMDRDNLYFSYRTYSSTACHEIKLVCDLTSILKIENINVKHT